MKRLEEELRLDSTTHARTHTHTQELCDLREKKSLVQAVLSSITKSVSKHPFHEDVSEHYGMYLVGKGFLPVRSPGRGGYCLEVWLVHEGPLVGTGLTELPQAALAGVGKQSQAPAALHLALLLCKATWGPPSPGHGQMFYEGRVPS